MTQTFSIIDQTHQNRAAHESDDGAGEDVRRLAIGRGRRDIGPGRFNRWIVMASGTRRISR